MCGNCSCSANKRAGHGSATRRAGAPSFFVLKLQGSDPARWGYILRQAAEEIEAGLKQGLPGRIASFGYMPQWWFEQGAARHEPAALCSQCGEQQNNWCPLRLAQGSVCFKRWRGRGEQDHMS